jgi:hypothetical protein
MLSIVKEQSYKEIQEQSLVAFLDRLTMNYERNINEGSYKKGTVIRTAVDLSHKVLDGGFNIIRNPIVDLFISDRNRALAVLYRYSETHEHTITVSFDKVYNGYGIVAYFEISTRGGGSPDTLPIAA